MNSMRFKSTFFLGLLLVSFATLAILTLNSAELMFKPIEGDPSLLHIHKRYEYLKFAFAGFGLFALSVYAYFLQKSLFKPIRRLVKNMRDFMENYETRDLDVPDESELGELQATFNSLAQIIHRQIRKLELADQSKTDFLNLATHELRTPLTSIKGALSLMKDHLPKNNASCIEMFNIASLETERIIFMINDLLDLARIDANSYSMALEWIDLQSLAEDVIKQLSPIAHEAQIHLTVTELDEDVEVLTDPGVLNQILTNLVGNAIKFSPRQGVVAIHFEYYKNHALAVKVSDQGRGLTPHELKQVFNKFKSQQGSTLQKGSGLGLAIVKALVEQLGGQISVQSEVGQGSTFFFTLPSCRLKQKQIKEAA